MLIKMIRDEDYLSYKEVSMMIAFPNCNFKCCKDANRSVSMCQNSPIWHMPTISVSSDAIVDRYMKNVITHSIVCGGLEPLDSVPDLIEFVSKLRKRTDDPLIVYTGYTEEESLFAILHLSLYSNVIMKFGRYVPSKPSHFDDLLGVTLASPNQYAKKIS